MSESTPIYMRIHDQIQQCIEEGKWQVGDRLPAERILAEQFSVSRMTLRQAIQTLADEGILERKVGSGTYVASQKVQEKMSGITSFTEIIENQGKTPSSKTVFYKIVKPNLQEQEALQIHSEDKIVRMERIRYANEIPICVETTSIPYEFIMNLDKTEISSSLYATLAKKENLRLGKAVQHITASLASDKIAELLELKVGEPILQLRQTTFLKDGRPLEYVRSKYAAHRFEFVLEK